MPSSWTPSLRFEQQFTGENINLWGDKLNVVLGHADYAVAGWLNKPLSGDTALSTANAGDDEARAAMIKFTGAGPFTVTLPSVSKTYHVWNACTAALTLTTGAGAVAKVQPGERVTVICDGADVARVQATDFGASKITSVGDPISPQDAATKKYVDDTAFDAIAGILPGQTGSAGKFLATDGETAAWASPLPNQTGAGGKVLTTDGAAAAWAPAFPDQTGNGGKVLTTDGTNASWALALPDQSGNAGKFIKTDGSSASWNAIALADVSGAAAVDLSNVAGSDFAGKTFTAAGSGAIVASGVGVRYGDTPNAIRDFGATGDGTTDDTAALQAFFDACQVHRKRGTLPGTTGFYSVTAPIQIRGTGGDVQGAGTQAAVIKGSGNFSEVFRATSTALERTFEDIFLDTTGTTTRCVTLDQGAQVVRFHRARFRGNLAGDLVNSQATAGLDFDNCIFDCNGANTRGLALDMLNADSRIANSVFTGIGFGMDLRKTGAQSAVLRTLIDGCRFLVTGPNAVGLLGGALDVIMSNCYISGATSTGVSVQNSTSRTKFIGCRFNLPASAVTALRFEPATSSVHTIIGNHFQGCVEGIRIGASATQRCDSVSIIGNTFSGISSTCLNLDSVFGCSIVGNRDSGIPSNGSWVTFGTFGAGVYFFDQNVWGANPPTSFHVGSTYRFGNDLGIVGRNRGANGTGGAATSLTISHGLFRTPARVVATPDGAVGTFRIFNVGATDFATSWQNAILPTIHWDAEV